MLNWCLVDGFVSTAPPVGGKSSVAEPGTAYLSRFPKSEVLEVVQ